MIRRPHSGEQGFWALRPRWIVLALCVLALVTLWVQREPVLSAIGRLVVEEPAPAPAELVVLHSNNPVLAAQEAATLITGGHAPQVLLFRPPPSPEEEIVARLGLPLPRPHDHDPFRPERWWQDRDAARELMMESLRWLNSFVLGDFWAERQPCARGDRWGSEGQGVAVAAGIGPALKRS